MNHITAHAGHGTTPPGHPVHAFEVAHVAPALLCIVLAAAWALNALKVPRAGGKS